jgi:hypothetical protein
VFGDFRQLLPPPGQLPGLIRKKHRRRRYIRAKMRRFKAVNQIADVPKSPSRTCAAQLPERCERKDRRNPLISCAILRQNGFEADLAGLNRTVKRSHSLD